MKARQLFERMSAPAPTIAPPKPKTKPETAPRPETPKPKRFDNPWRRRHLRPGEEPAPKACKIGEARRLIEMDGGTPEDAAFDAVTRSLSQQGRSVTPENAATLKRLIMTDSDVRKRLGLPPVGGGSSGAEGGVALPPAEGQGAPGPEAGPARPFESRPTKARNLFA